MPFVPPPPLVAAAVPVTSMSELIAAAANATGPAAVSIQNDFAGNGSIAVSYDFAVLGNAHVLTSEMTFTGMGDVYVKDLTITSGCLHANTITGALVLDGVVSVTASDDFLDGITAKSLIILGSAVVIADGGNFSARGIFVQGDMTLEPGAKVAARGGITQGSSSNGGNGLQTQGMLSVGANARVLAAGGGSSLGNGGNGMICGTGMTAHNAAWITGIGGNGAAKGGNGILIGTLSAPGPLSVPQGEYPRLVGRGGGKQSSDSATDGNGFVTALAQEATIIGDFTADSSYAPALSGTGPGGFVIYNASGAAPLFILEMLEPRPIDLYYGNGVNAPKNVFFAQETLAFFLDSLRLSLSCGQSATLSIAAIFPEESVHGPVSWSSTNPSVASVIPSVGGLSAVVLAGSQEGSAAIVARMARPVGDDLLEAALVYVSCPSPPNPTPGRDVRFRRCRRRFLPSQRHPC